MRNIEATARAKQEMMEHRRKEHEERAAKRPEDEDFAAARCGSLLVLIHVGCAEYAKVFKPGGKAISDVYAGSGYQTRFLADYKPNPAREPRQEAATDEQVYERFKKRSVPAHNCLVVTDGIRTG